MYILRNIIKPDSINKYFYLINIFIFFLDKLNNIFKAFYYIKIKDDVIKHFYFSLN